MAQPKVGAQASRLAKDLTLRGSSIPKLVYGTAWKKEQTADLVYQALKNGFRGIDTAAQPKHYNERGVGLGVQRAIREGIARREDLFIQTKFSPPISQGPDPPYNLGDPLPDQIHQSIQSSLDIFTLEGQDAYLDSVVMHSPLETIDETLAAWKTLETYTPHKIRSLGISNVTLDVLKVLYEEASLKPSVVQNRFYLGTGFDLELRAFCREKSIVFQSFWTLSANKKLVQSGPVISIAQGTGVPPAVAFYCLVLGLEGIAILDGTTKESHMKEDLEGLEKVGAWAEGGGLQEWNFALSEFKRIIRTSLNIVS